MSMRTVVQLFFSVLFVAYLGCIPSTSISPPAGWRYVPNARCEFWVPPDIKAWAALDTNAMYDHFCGTNIELSFGFERSDEDFAGFANAPHFVRTGERIGGRKAEIVSFYYDAAEPPNYELIAIRFPEPDNLGLMFHMEAACMSTNDYETAKSIFRTIRFR